VPLLAQLKRHRWLILVIMTATVVAAVAYLAISGPTYRATARLLINPIEQQDAPLIDAPLIRNTGDPVRTIQTAAGLIQSRAAAALAADSLRGGWTTDSVAAAVTVRPEGESSIVAVLGDADSPAAAARVVNTYVTAMLTQRRGTFQRVVEGPLKSARARLAILGNSRGGEASSLARQISQLEGVDRQDPNIARVEPVASPGTLTGPPRWVVVALALLAGGILSVGIVLLIENFGPKRIFSEHQLVGVYPLPVLARVPLAGRRGDRSHGLTPRDLRPFGAVRMQFEFMSPQPRLLAVTGAPDGDGKSIAVAGLALALAGAGHRVLILSADPDRAALRAALRLDGERPSYVHPFTAQLGAPVTQATEAVSGISGLRVMAIESPPVFPQAKVLAKLLRHLADQAQPEAEYVIIDAPPVDSSGEAVVLASAVDAALFVVALEATQRDRLELARDLLDRSGVEPLGFVVLGAT
jgi:Mrp family chromosome partitioning ATPase/capsular polysaccharide biosynthesis protein